MAYPDNVLMGTEAHHRLGDISRDEPDYFVVESEDSDNYYGHWIAGFGLMNVRFPKSGARPMTEAEATRLTSSEWVIA